LILGNTMSNHPGAQGTFNGGRARADEYDTGGEECENTGGGARMPAPALHYNGSRRMAGMFERNDTSGDGERTGSDTVGEGWDRGSDTAGEGRGKGATWEEIRERHKQRTSGAPGKMERKEETHVSSKQTFRDVAAAPEGEKCIYIDIGIGIPGEERGDARFFEPDV